MHNNLPISLVIFDCDGVILENVDVKTKAFGLTVVEHGSKAVARLMEYHTANGGVSRYKKFEWFYREVLGREITQNELKTLGERFKQLVFDESMNAPLVAGSLECIKALHNQIPMFVASGAPHEELTAVLNARDLSRFFKECYGLPPGKTELVRRIIYQMGVAPEKTIMVGDSSTDLNAAQECGTLFFGRGEYFEQFGLPWSKCLHGLLEYVRTMHICKKTNAGIGAADGKLNCF